MCGSAVAPKRRLSWDHLCVSFEAPSLLTSSQFSVTLPVSNSSMDISTPGYAHDTAHANEALRYYCMAPSGTALPNYGSTLQQEDLLKGGTRLSKDSRGGVVGCGHALGSHSAAQTVSRAVQATLLGLRQVGYDTTPTSNGPSSGGIEAPDSPARILPTSCKSSSSPPNPPSSPHAPGKEIAWTLISENTAESPIQKESPHHKRRGYGAFPARYCSWILEAWNARALTRKLCAEISAKDAKQLA